MSPCKRSITFNLQRLEISNYFANFIKRVAVTDCTMFDPIVVQPMSMDLFWLNWNFGTNAIFRTWEKQRNLNQNQNDHFGYETECV